MASPSSSHSQIKTLLDEDDSNPFFHFLNNLFSDDEAVRRPADSLFNAAMKEFPNALSNKLAFAINSNPNPQIRIRCSTLFSRFLDNNWLLLVHPMFHTKFKTFFIQLLRDEEDWEALKIHCTCVSKLAALFFPKPGWPELLVSMFQWLCSPDFTLTNPASVILLNILIPKYCRFFYDYADILNLVFQRLMDQGSGDTRLRSAAVGAAVKLIVYLAIPNDYYEYYGLLTGMISVLGDVIFGDQDLACSVLDEMVVLARGKPWFLAVHIKSMVEAMLKIVSDTGLEEKTRKLAVEFLVTVAEGGDEGYEMIQKLPSNLIEELLAQLLRMLMCVKDDISWMVEENADDMEAEGKMSISCYAEEALSRLAIALGGDVILPNSRDMLPGFFEDDDWKKRYAAVTALGLIASGCSKMLVQNLEHSVEKIMELVHDEHPRVRLATLHAIRKFSKSLSPFFQEQCHRQVILALSDAMDDFGNPRVQIHAASALTSFSQNCCSNILKSYLKEIISKLFIFLQNEKTVLKETALKALASLADSTKDDFQPFYATVLSYLKYTLITAKENSNCMLVAKTLECITLVAVAVGKSVFSADVEEAWGRLCTSLGEDFRPYLSASMPQLIKSAELHSLVADDRNSENELRSIVLKEILLACKTLGCFAAHIKGGLHLWIQEVLNAVLPLVNFKFDEQVRIAAISVMPLLLQSAAIAMENKLLIPGFLDSPIDALSKTITPALLESLEASGIKTQVQILAALNQGFQIANTWIPDDTETVESLSQVLSACFHRKAGREYIVQNSLIFQKPELLKEEIQDEENVCREVRICFQLLIKRLSAQNLVLQIYFVKHMWAKSATLEKRRMALSIFSDIAEQCGEQGLRHYAVIIPFLFKACKDTNPDTRQIAACAIGIFVEFGREVFKQHLQDGLSSLEDIFQHSEGSGLEHFMAKDAAVCAYGKVCFFLCEEINSYENIELWLFHLPLKCNFDEAKAAHGLLCSMVDKPETRVTGPEDGYISRIITIMAEVLWAGNNFATEETRSMMIQQLKMLKQKLADKFIGICKSLPPTLQNTLYSCCLSS
ncbi:importin-5-like isoform X2 [Ipomoea triloba]|uniref:importin-5-like isoform X2 n=1 Tax=Ipomoea triloba TaxID=35885 RepID=UPI00125D7193|nr:importin-5-like isoform X2 [Ipomoea triloba]